MAALPVASATLDGEGVIVDERGVTDFERLRSALAGRDGSRSVFLYGFDLLELDGHDLRREAWEIRRSTLTGLLRKARSGIRLSEHLNGDGETIFRHACALGAEGIVAKRRDRPYRSGRCADWVKVRNPPPPPPGSWSGSDGARLKPETIASEQRVPERLMLFCLASRTEWDRSVTHATPQHLLARPIDRTATSARFRLTPLGRDVFAALIKPPI